MRIILLSVVAFLGCAHVQEPAAPVAAPPAVEPLRARDLYPLRVGNKWVYEVRSAGQRVVRAVTITGEENGFFLFDPPARLRHDAKGVRDQDRYLIENPVEPGHAWFSVISVQSSENFVVTSAGSPCTVQAGTFGRCATIRATSAIDANRSIVIESTYAEGVGLVAMHIDQVMKGRPSVTAQEMELISYQLAP